MRVAGLLSRPRGGNTEVNTSSFGVPNLNRGAVIGVFSLYASTLSIYSSSSRYVRSNHLYNSALSWLFDV